MSQYLLSNLHETRCSNSGSSLYDLAAVIVHHGSGYLYFFYQFFLFFGKFINEVVQEKKIIKVARLKKKNLVNTR